MKPVIVENLLYCNQYMDSDNQNTIELSVVSGRENIYPEESDSQREEQQSNVYRKNGWLKNFFVSVKEGENLSVECRSCAKRFKNRGHNRMIRHAKMCFKSDEVMPIDDSNLTQINILFAEMMIDTGWSLSGIERKSFRKFIQRLNRNWVIPDRKAIAGNYYSHLSEQAYAEFKKKLQDGSIRYISVEFDHWEDTNNRSFLGILATSENGNRYLLDLRDVSLKGHSARVIVEEVLDVLKDLPNQSVNSFVSDSASSCKKARQDLIASANFKHTVHHRCLAHFTNLIGSRIETQNYRVSTTIKLVTKIVGHISNSNYWSAYIKEQNMNKVKSACSVRWYSTISMLEGILDLKTVILEEILQKLDSEKARVVNELDWGLIQDLIDQLKPLCSCIGAIERKDCSLGTGVNVLLKYAKWLFQGSTDDDFEQTNDGVQIRIQARQAFLHYMSEEKLDNYELGLWLASYALDRRYNMDYLTDEGKKLCFEAIALVAVRSRATLEQVTASLFLEFNYYARFEGEYKPTLSEPKVWWPSRMSSGLLAQVGLRLAHLKASSANIERAFSSVKYIQGDCRLNLATHTLLHVSRLKIRSKNTVIVEESVPQPSDQFQENEIQDTSDILLSQCSTITTEASSFWIQDLDINIKKSYQRFFKFIDFAIINEYNENEDTTDKNISEEEVLTCVRSCLHPSSQL